MQGFPDPPENELITRDELLAQLREQGIYIPERTLQHWETTGLLPAPIRRWHKGATRALYPPWALDLAAMAQNYKWYGEDPKHIGAMLLSLLRTTLARREMENLPVMQYRLPAALSELADHYEDALGVRPAFVELRILGPDQNDLDKSLRLEVPNLRGRYQHAKSDE